MMKKVIAFDLDDTLAVTKSPISDRISELLGMLLETHQVCVISGGRFEQFKKQASILWRCRQNDSIAYRMLASYES